MLEQGDRLRVVIDTNLLVSGTIISRGRPFTLLQRWRTGAFTLLTSAAQIDEIGEVINRPHIKQKYQLADLDIDALLRDLSRLTEPIESRSPTVIPLRDADDEAILMLGIDGAAEFIVTGDDDLLSIADDQRLGSLRIVTATAFLELIGGR